MKKQLATAFAIACISANAQQPAEQEINTVVKEVTIFLDGAQIERSKTITLPKGESTLRFVNLSPFIDAKSIQVNASDDLPIISVNHQQNYLEKSKKSAEIETLTKKLDTIEENIKKEENAKTVVKYEIEFLQANKSIGGKNDQLNVPNLQLAADFYGKRLTNLMDSDLNIAKNIKELEKQRNDISSQMRALSSKKEYPSGEIVVKAKSPQGGTYKFNLSYMVSNAGWFPSYDLRATNVSQPLLLAYKANVRQDSKEDWDNVKIHLSSAEPSTSSVAPALKTYLLNYNTVPPTYKKISNNIRGRVVGDNYEPLPGATVVVAGTSIGAIADIDGFYTITIPNTSSSLSFSYLGYEKKTLAVTGDIMNVELQKDSKEIEECIVVNSDIAMETEEKATPLFSVSKKERVTAAGKNTIATQQAEKQTAVEFSIDMPYTIKSGNKSYAVEIANYEIPAKYQYYAAPKVNKDAFLVANIVDWEKFNLMEGEATIFFENTYLGKMVLDVRNATDTLTLSLGRDKKISVARERVKNFTDKQLIGSKKEDTRVWKTIVKNNKAEEINMIVLDQIPVSTLEEIEVIAKNITGKLNAETGEVRWNFTLMPNESKQLDLNYSIKYPKNRSLVIE